MNELLTVLGLAAWKPALTALALPPVPLLLLALIGARLMYWRRGVAWSFLVTAVVGLWLSCCTGVGDWLEPHLAPSPAPLGPERIAELRRSTGPGHKLAVLILGGGRESLAPEYALSNLSSVSMARLHYGLWLARQINAPVMFSGGIGHGQAVGASEAQTASRIAEQDYGRPLKWAEGESRDTRENASYSLAILAPAGVTDVVLVTHGWHMQRALRDFEAEVRRGGSAIRLLPAPMGLARSDPGALRWLPSHQGFTQVRMVLRERLGLLVGA